MNRHSYSFNFKWTHKVSPSGKQTQSLCQLNRHSHSHKSTDCYSGKGTLRTDTVTVSIEQTQSMSDEQTQSHCQGNRQSNSVNWIDSQCQMNRHHSQCKMNRHSHSVKWTDTVTASSEHTHSQCQGNKHSQCQMNTHHSVKGTDTVSVKWTDTVTVSSEQTQIPPQSSSGLKQSAKKTAKAKQRVFCCTLWTLLTLALVFSVK